MSEDNFHCKIKPVKYTIEFMQRFYLSSNYKNHDKLKFTENDKEL